MNPKQPPPETLNKETIGVWNGWNNMGDEKVAHEAAIKGLHISLAIKFLSLRQGKELEAAKFWFEEEVRRWVLELLDRKQIGRASHILSNIGLKADKELSLIFYKTKNNTLREYIGQYLTKNNKLDEEYKLLWKFFNLIEENKIDISNKKIDSIECLSGQSDRQKAEIAATVFLKTDDATLVKYLCPEIFWEHLILNLDTNHIITWINIRYNLSFQSDLSNCADYFKKHHITNEMLNFLWDQQDSLFKNVILNNFASFGVFTNNEKTNLVAILNRLKITKNITNIVEIFSKSWASLSLETFNRLLLEFCLDRKLFEILGDLVQYFKLTIPNSNELGLLQEMYFLVNDFSAYNLANNILQYADLDYLRGNFTDLIALIICKNDAVSRDLAIEGLHLSTAVDGLFENFKILNSVLEQKSDFELTIYELLETHQPYTMAQLLPAYATFPNFQNLDLGKEYAYKKQLGYIFYLRQARPCIAAKYYFLKNFKDQSFVENKIFKLALLNFDDLRITSACIAFLEIVGCNSTKIRLLVKIARILVKFGFERSVVLKLLNNDEPDTIQHHIESILIDQIDENNIIQAFKMFELMVYYSQINNLKYPEAFLKYCASKNMWLLFFIFAQIHSYPLDQVKFHIQFFKSANLLEHLRHGICNEMPEERHSRDSRKYLLSKVGVISKNLSPNQSSALSYKSQSSYESEEISSGGVEHFEIDVSNIKATLLQTLIRCHSSTDPPKAFLQACQFYRNALLAVFATSYEPDSIITNWLTWLGVSCELYQIFTNYEAIAFSANAVTDLLENCLVNNFLNTLLQSFIIFIPDNPLRIFIQLLVEDFTLDIKNRKIEVQLNLFKKSLKTLRHNSTISETDHEMTYLNNRQWIEVTALRLLAAFLDHHCKSRHDQIVILEALIEIKIWEKFWCDVPHLQTILAILKVLNDSKSDVRLDITRMFQAGTKREATIECITNLLDKHYYQAALEISKIKKLPPDLILIKECQHQMMSKNDPSFWHASNKIFESYNVTADCVIDFYVECIDIVRDQHEKCVLSKLAYEWASKYNLSSQYELERKMWLYFLDLDDQQRESAFLTISPSEDLSDLNKTLPMSSAETEVDPEVTHRAEKFLEYVLRRGNFELALKLHQMFCCNNSDLEILKLCHDLAEGVLLPHQLSQKQRLSLTNYNTRKSGRLHVKRKISSICSGSYNPLNVSNSLLDVVESSPNDTLTILKLLVENLINGIEIGENIFMAYRISLNIEIPYKIVILIKDHRKMLRDALDSDCHNKLDVVHDVAVIYKWTKPELVDFICEELITAMIECIKSNQEMKMWDLNLDNNFQLIFQLLQEASTALGRKIFTYLSALHKSQKESRLCKKDVVLIVELLIRAHDCFATDCNMEGISLILEKCKEVISDLLTLQEWRLIVRLLTQVARYTEMSYVFQLLLENDQFECLLTKNLKKDNVLKMALLTFFKKHWPENNEVYKIISLHFALFPEVAQLWEREAFSIIKNQITIGKLEMQNNKLNPDEEIFVMFYNNQSLINCLNRAMENYTHATQFYLRGEKMSKALHSAKQAELIALQILFIREVSLQETTPCLLFLTTFQLTKILSRKFSFSQLRILLEAYNFSPDWSSVLYEQYIINNQDEFFDEFLEHFPLTDTLVQDIYRKIFVSNNNFSARSMTCMKNILNHVPSILFKYRIASELGFTDLIADLISSGQLMYLKDTVWKKGFKSS